MKTYYLSCLEGRFPALLGMLQKAGILSCTEQPCETGSGAWDFIGPVYRHLGEELVPVTTPAGEALWHANLLTDHPIREMLDAETLSEFLRTNPDGSDWEPSHPYRIFAR